MVFEPSRVFFYSLFIHKSYLYLIIICLSSSLSVKDDFDNMEA